METYIKIVYVTFLIIIIYRVYKDEFIVEVTIKLI